MLKDISVCRGKIDSKLVSETKAARKAMHSFIEDTNKATAAGIRTALTKNNRALQSLSKQWRIEFNFYLSQVGETGELRMQKLVLESLPSPKKGVSLKDARDAIKLLVEGALFHFVGLALQRGSTTTMHWLDMVVASRPPNIPKSGTDSFTSKVAMSMSYVVRAQVKAKGVVKSVYGKEAVENKFAAIDAVVAQKKKPALEQLRPLGLFKWLLSQKQQTQLKEWTTLSMEGVAVQTPKKTAAFAKASTNAPSSKKRKTDTEAAMEWADFLFGDFVQAVVCRTCAARGQDSGRDRRWDPHWYRPFAWLVWSSSHDHRWDLPFEVGMLSLFGVPLGEVRDAKLSRLKAFVAEHIRKCPRALA